VCSVQKKIFLIILPDKLNVFYKKIPDLFYLFVFSDFLAEFCKVFCKKIL